MSNCPDSDGVSVCCHLRRGVREPYQFPSPRQLSLGSEPRAARSAGVCAVLAWLLGTGLSIPGPSIQWQRVSLESTASFRGLSVSRDGSIWVGGTRGTVLRSPDAGRTWSVDSVAGASRFDFRGAAAISSEIAYVAVSSADTGRVYKTADGGRSWTLQYRNETPGVFLDGIACWDARRCLAVGDPIAGRFFLLTTRSGGSHWKREDTAAAPRAIAGEAAFAASNSSLVAGSGGQAWFATGGGPTARVWRTSDYGITWRVATTPVAAARPSAGIFSLAFCDVQHGIAVGGDYAAPDSTGAHVALTADGGETWTPGDAAHVVPYVSGVTCVRRAGHQFAFVAVGPAGTFASSDGRAWHRAAPDGFNAVATLRGQRLIAVGAQGAVATAALR